MDDRITETALSLTKFGVGQPVQRSEDPTLVRGQGRYTDDVSRPNQAYAVMVRSRDAHGVIRSIDTAGAKAMPGVLAVYTAADLTGYGPLKCGLPLKNRDGSPIRYAPRPALAGDKVRFVGDPVACVIAETVAQAKDAAEAVTLDIEPLPAVLKPSEAVKPGAPLVFDEVPNNIALDYHYGDAAKVAEAFAKAKHVTRLETSNQRMVVNAMEPRSAIGEYDATAAKWTLYSTSQGVHGMKTSLMEILGAPADKVRVITGQVGGSFGMKAAVYPEYVCLLHGARLLGRPVKWTDERSGSFVSDHHGRAQDMVVSGRQRPTCPSAPCRSGTVSPSRRPWQTGHRSSARPRSFPRDRPARGTRSRPSSPGLPRSAPGCRDMSSPVARGGARAQSGTLLLLRRPPVSRSPTSCSRRRLPSH